MQATFINIHGKVKIIYLMKYFLPEILLLSPNRVEIEIPPDPGPPKYPGPIPGIPTYHLLTEPSILTPG